MVNLKRLMLETDVDNVVEEKGHVRYFASKVKPPFLNVVKEVFENACYCT
ncbi:MAG: hypothetical protein FWG67_10320 [Defluviitaleaceae bacterium]|nr:hypothetical protein [Defluviitaleaceae bacterium]